MFSPKRQEIDASKGSIYVARGSITVTPGDVRQIGDAVPEAFGWRKTRAMLSIGRLVYVPNKPERPVKAKK